MHTGLHISLILIATGALSSAQTTAPLAPFNGSERMRWLLRENLSPTSLLENVAIGAATTFSNTPKEYGPHWEGFGKRTGMVTANYGVRTVMEASLGSLWKEDPRYVRTQGKSFGKRLGNAIKMAFVARNDAGHAVPAYARFVAIPGSSFMANAWLPDSQATAGNAAARAGLSFLSQMGSNAFQEFRPRH